MRNQNKSCEKEYVGKARNENGWKKSAMSILEERPPNQREHLTQSPYGKKEQACMFKEFFNKKIM